MSERSLIGKRWRFVISGAKQEETKKRRLGKVTTVLKTGRSGRVNGIPPKRSALSKKEVKVSALSQKPRQGWGTLSNPTAVRSWGVIVSRWRRCRCPGTDGWPRCQRLRLRGRRGHLRE